MTLFFFIFSSGRERNFNRYPTQEVDFAGGMYDFESIMHYGNYLFSRNRKMTMQAIKDPSLLFGQKLRLSKTDILQLNAVYDCKSKWSFCGHFNKTFKLSSFIFIYCQWRAMLCHAASGVTCHASRKEATNIAKKTDNGIKATLFVVHRQIYELIYHCL